MKLLTKRSARRDKEVELSLTVYMRELLLSFETGIKQVSIKALNNKISKRYRKKTCNSGKWKYYFFSSFGSKKRDLHRKYYLHFIFKLAQNTAGLVWWGLKWQVWLEVNVLLSTDNVWRSCFFSLVEFCFKLASSGSKIA